MRACFGVPTASTMGGMLAGAIRTSNVTWSSLGFAKFLQVMCVFARVCERARVCTCVCVCACVSVSEEGLLLK